MAGDGRQEQRAELWSETIFDLRTADFTQADPPTSEGDGPNLIVCNPPYLRHEELDPDEKRRVRDVVERTCGVELSLRSGRQTRRSASN